MKSFSALIVFLLFLSLTAIRYPAYAFADSAKAYNDLTYTYSVYRQAHSDYKVAKSSYLTYRTLTSQNEAIDRLRKVLQVRAQVVSVYYDLLQERLSEDPSADDTTKTTFYNIKQSEKTWMEGHQKKVDAAASLDDLNSVSGEFESRFPQMDRETKQTIGALLLGTEDNLGQRTTQMAATISATLSSLRLEGLDTASFERGLITANNKMEIYNEKLTQSKDTVYPKGGQIDLLSITQSLTSANQYLREATDLLNEIVKTLLGQ